MMNEARQLSIRSKPNDNDKKNIMSSIIEIYKETTRKLNQKYFLKNIIQMKSINTPKSSEEMNNQNFEFCNRNKKLKISGYCPIDKFDKKEKGEIYLNCKNYKETSCLVNNKPSLMSPRVMHSENRNRPIRPPQQIKAPNANRIDKIDIRQKNKILSIEIAKQFNAKNSLNIKICESNKYAMSKERSTKKSYNNQLYPSKLVELEKKKEIYIQILQINIFLNIIKFLRTKDLLFLCISSKLFKNNKYKEIINISLLNLSLNVNISRE